ncbi:ATP-binding protein [Patescibacteria group bacterium]|nr:MAG: ATP-binding protein [Patescibacteria group bacterium]
MNVKKLFILCGEAFSGKSTLAKQIAERYQAKIVGRDAIYFATEEILALENTPEKADENLWNNLWPLVIQGVKNQLLDGHSAVVDDNCLFLRQRDDLRSAAKEVDTESILIYLDVPTSLLRERKAKNKLLRTRHDVPSAWLMEDSQIFERPTQGENPVIYTPSDTFNSLTKELERNF